MILKDTKLYNCFHCGDQCFEDSIKIEDKQFCCNGCKTVFEILSENKLNNFYNIKSEAGISQKEKRKESFAFLESKEIQDKLVDFKNDTISKITLYLPQIHCSACVWLIENLYQINPSIENSRVNFLRKEVTVTFLHQQINLRQLVELLASLGYSPSISLSDTTDKEKKSVSKKLVYQIGLAGFAFGNIMLMSLPEYFGLDKESVRNFTPLFGLLNILLATPVAIYSGQDYFKSAWSSLKRKKLNIDVPIVLGLVALFFRSLYEIVLQLGPGYFDSLCGLLFFLLLGRIFQEKTYHRLSFERDYRSYFPVAVCRKQKNIEENIAIQEVKIGDRLLIRNGELIPVDSVLICGKAELDNSFVTGESELVEINSGEKIYAGGRQMGGIIEVEVIKLLSQSKLTRIWNEQFDAKNETASFSKLTDSISQWFTPIILLLAIIAGGIHIQSGIGAAVEVFSSVLIIACPCALALAAPFTFGHAIRWLGEQSCYLRNANIIENVAKVNTIVFDKTGTLTNSRQQKVTFEGSVLAAKHRSAVFSIFRQSSHVLSRTIANSINNIEVLEAIGFKESVGKGLQATVGGVFYRLGSGKWLNAPTINVENTEVYVEIDGCLEGKYIIDNTFRPSLREVINRLNGVYKLAIISGDNNKQEQTLQKVFPPESEMRFNQSPEDKLDSIKYFQFNGSNTMMVGDGLNDAGALKQSNVGMTISEDINTFSPACDIILNAKQFHNLPDILGFTKHCRTIVILSYVLSFFYNIFGLSLAFQAKLSPIVSAILMPLSSISVVAFVSLAVWLIRPRKFTDS